jgi:hypothetical protein
MVIDVGRRVWRDLFEDDRGLCSPDERLLSPVVMVDAVANGDNRLLQVLEDRSNRIRISTYLFLGRSALACDRV